MSYDSSLWEAKLAQINTSGLTRSRLAIAGAQGSSVCVNAQSLLNFASNDYLGFANHPLIREAVISGVNQYGWGSGASDVVCGHFEAHQALEHELAEFLNRDQVLLFSSGYMANLAVSAALCDNKSFILQDKLNHASLIDGARLSGARLQRYLHCSSESLLSHFSRFSDNDTFSHKMVVSDGVFSMDGDIAPLKALANICDDHSATLAIDDAHGLGVLGDQGRGSLDEAGLTQADCPLLIGTFGKAFGSFGAFIAGPSALIEYLNQRARTHIYTTSLPPAVIEATRQSLKLVATAASERAKLKHLISLFREALEVEGFNLLDSYTPIQGVVVGENEATVRLGEYLKANGVLVGAIRPPTVAAGSARLRITLSAAHQEQDVMCLVDALKQAKREGVIHAS